MDTNLVHLAEKYGLQLRKLGSNKYQCKCPYPDHEDSTPSFTIYGENNSYYCFGCQRSGNWRSFLALMDPQALDGYNVDVERLETALLRHTPPNLKEALMLQSSVLFYDYLQIKDPLFVLSVMKMFDGAMVVKDFIDCSEQIRLLRLLEETLNKNEA